MKTFFSVFISILLFSHLNFLIAQYQLGEKWVARYNGTGNGSESAYSVAVDGSGNVLVTGTSASSNDIVTIKYNSAGVQQWIQIYNGPGNSTDEGRFIAVDASGNVFVIGNSNGGSSSIDFVTIKYNSAGVQQWVQRYTGIVSTGIDRASALTLDASGNVYVSGNSNGDYASIKYNTSGTVLWLQRYNGTGNGTDQPSGIVVDVSGNAYVTGYSMGSGSGTDYLTIKYNSSGVQQWSQRYNGAGNGNDNAYSMAIDPTGNIYITGSSTSISNGYDYCTIKYNTNGVQQWIVLNSWQFDDLADEILVASDGSIYITGYSPGSTVGNFDVMTVKISNTGGTLWTNRYNGPGNESDMGNSIAIDNLGSLYVSGVSIGVGTSADYILLRYSTSGGNPISETRYNGPGNNSDVSTDNIIDANGCVYLTGYSYGSNLDYCTIKYVPLAAAPVLVSPANNSTGISCTPLLNWNDVVNAETYTVQVSTNSGFTSFNVNQSGLTNSQYQVTTGTLQNNVLYYWRACAVNAAGTGPWSTVWSFRTALVGIQPVSIEIPEVYKLYSNSPNPFNPSTDIRFDIPKAGFVILKVFDAYGKEIETIVNETLTPGKYNAVFNGGNLSSGVYFYHFFTDYFSDTKKMVLVK